MLRGSRVHLLASAAMALPLCVLVAVGCQPNSGGGPGAPGTSGPANASGGPMSSSGGQTKMGGPGGGKMEGGGALAENATGAEIIKAKCGCHGPDGVSGRAPSLAKAAGDSEADIAKVIHDGKGNKMPAFGSKLSDAQIKTVATYIKTLK